MIAAEVATEFLYNYPIADQFNASFAHAQLAQAIAAALAQEREVYAKLAENPYCNEVDCRGFYEPLEVGKHIAAAIRKTGGNK